jgi:hypothetical protein
MIEKLCLMCGHCSALPQFAKGLWPEDRYEDTQVGHALFCVKHPAPSSSAPVAGIRGFREWNTYAQSCRHYGKE